ncbi:DoxX-like family protein [Paucisalibacillus sp. EB02]|uniref:DoxX-like family protein n=1 Tax=Paucisalibacillus sp. EB02 TaxID=1347087 RepID=UPI0004B53980|nr:DoxX-like family protein [Paucisalibacillus sp. EB02]
MVKSKPIYVETVIRAEMDKLWKATQEPNLHQKWDLRFSEIKYLPKEEGKPQEFLYRTNIGFGLSVEGWGKSVGSFHAEDDSRTSALHFGTDQKISIIKEGRGYWKYIPTQNNSIQFLTQYNYEPSFGRFGRMIDHVIFRPLMGWATALSFDVLKRWMETGETPASQFIRFFSHALLTVFFIFIWAYHGMIPKLVAMHPDEITMVTNVLPFTKNQGESIALIAGILEVLFAIVWMFYQNKRRLFYLQALVFPILMVGAIISDFSYLFQPFNPLTFNLALFVLSLIGLFFSKDMPTAKNCKRER